METTMEWWVKNSGEVEVWGASVTVDKMTVYQMYNWHGGDVHIV